jgi:hypothetical protein
MPPRRPRPRRGGGGPRRRDRLREQRLVEHGVGDQRGDPHRDRHHPRRHRPVGVAVNPATDTACVTNIGDGTVSVISAARPVSGPIVSGYRAGKCVADTGDSAVNDTPITVATCDGSPSQNWTVTSSGNPAGQRQMPGHLPRPENQQGPRRTVDLHRRRQPAMAAHQRGTGQPALRQMPRRPQVQHHSRHPARALHLQRRRQPAMETP